MATAAQTEAERLAAAPREGYDRVVRLTQAVFGVPIAALNLLGAKTQYTVAAVGIPQQEIPVERSICRFAVQGDEILEIPDLREDERSRDLDIVVEPPRVRYYAGVPLKSTSGQNVGVLCILDVTPRQLGATQREMLADLGAVVERELAVQEEMLRAGEVQRQLLPTQTPDVPGYELAGRVVQAREAGGDFFDWQVIENPDGPDRLQVVLGDVMGKGLSASLLAAEVRAVLRGHSRYVDVGGTLGRATKTAQHDLEVNGRFVTMWVGRIDPADGRLDYIDVGHGLAVLVTPDRVTRLAMDYMPFGTPVEQDWKQATVHMAPGDMLVVVSDGVFDVFGSVEAATARIPDLLAQARTCTQIVDTIVDYASTHGTTDDVTALVVRRTEDG